MKPECKDDLFDAGMLTVVVFVAHHLSEFLEKMVVQGNQYAWILLFFWYAAFILAYLKLRRKSRK